MAAIAYLDGVIVVPPPRTGVRLPLGHEIEALRDICPGGQYVASVRRLPCTLVAFDVRRELPLIGVLHQRRGQSLCKVSLCGVEDHRPPALPYRILPCRNISAVAISNTVEFDVIDSPFCEPIHP